MQENTDKQKLPLTKHNASFKMINNFTSKYSTHNSQVLKFF